MNKQRLILIKGKNISQALLLAKSLVNDGDKVLDIEQFYLKIVVENPDIVKTLINFFGDKYSNKKGGLKWWALLKMATENMHKFKILNNLIFPYLKAEILKLSDQVEGNLVLVGRMVEYLGLEDRAFKKIELLDEAKEGSGFSGKLQNEKVWQAYRNIWKSTDWSGNFEDWRGF